MTFRYSVSQMCFCYTNCQDKTKRKTSKCVLACMHSESDEFERKSSVTAPLLLLYTLPVFYIVLMFTLSLLFVLFIQYDRVHMLTTLYSVRFK